MKYEIDPERLEAQAEQAAAFLRSLASKHRLAILCRLLDGERSAGQLAELLAVTNSNLSQHLTRLKEEGLVTTRRDGTTIYYRLASDRVEPVLAELYQIFCAPKAIRPD